MYIRRKRLEISGNSHVQEQCTSYTNSKETKYGNYNTSCKKSEEHGWHPQEKQHRQREFVYWIISTILTGLTVGGAIASAIFANIALKASLDSLGEARNGTAQARRQANASEAQVGMAIDTEKRQLRAYILPFKMGIEITKENKVDATIIIKNFGQTPAHNFRHWACINIRNLVVREFAIVDPTDLPPWPAGITPSITVAQGDTSTIFPVFFCEKNTVNLRPLTSDELAAINAGTKAIFLYGKIEYDDIFGDHHHTAYLRLRIISPSGHSVVNAAQGNSDD